MKDFLNCCLVANLERRKSAQDLLSHRIFAKCSRLPIPRSDALNYVFRASPLQLPSRTELLSTISSTQDDFLFVDRVNAPVSLASGVSASSAIGASGGGGGKMAGSAAIAMQTQNQQLAHSGAGGDADGAGEQRDLIFTRPLEELYFLWTLIGGTVDLHSELIRAGLLTDIPPILKLPRLAYCTGTLIIDRFQIHLKFFYLTEFVRIVLSDFQSTFVG